MKPRTAQRAIQSKEGLSVNPNIEHCTVQHRIYLIVNVLLLEQLSLFHSVVAEQRPGSAGRAAVD